MEKTFSVKNNFSLLLILLGPESVMIGYKGAVQTPPHVSLDLSDQSEAALRLDNQ